MCGTRLTINLQVSSISLVLTVLRFHQFSVFQVSRPQFLSDTRNGHRQ